MKHRVDDIFWIVINPSLVSEIGDILFECSLRRLELQFKGGLSAEKDNPTLFSDQQEAEKEAKARLREI